LRKRSVESRADGTGLGVFLAIALGLALFPPVLAHPPKLKFTTASVLFAALVTVVVIVVLVTLPRLPCTGQNADSVHK
jgi:hypothetical protein